MRRNDAVKGIFTILPLTVLCMLYGLWLVVESPTYVESILVGGASLLLFCFLYVRLVTKVFDFALDADREQSADRWKRTSILGVREIVRLLLVLVLARALVLVGAFLWRLYLFGYAETIIDTQHIWADHMFAARIISLVNNGYRADVPGYPGQYLNLLFPPLYALLVRLISPFYASSIRAAFFVSNLNYIFSGIVLYGLVLHDMDRRSADRALWYFVILPPSFLLGCTIPASTFMLGSLVCLYLARRKQFIGAAVAGFIATLADISGVVLIVPLLLEFLHTMTGEYRMQSSVSWRFYLSRGAIGASIILVPLGFILYLIINQTVAGDSFAYSSYFSQLFSSQQALFYRSMAAICEKGIFAYLSADTATLWGICVPNLLAGLLGFALLLATRDKLRTSIVAYGVAAILFAYRQTGVFDAPRQLFCCVAFIMATAITRNRAVHALISALCMAGTVAYLGMYVVGWPIA